MRISTIRKKGQVTIPQEVREAAQLDEGAAVEFVVVPEGVLMRRRVTVSIDPAQAWFWTPEWQAQMAAAQADLDAGRSSVFESSRSFLDALADGKS